MITHMDADHAAGYENLLGLREVWTRDWISGELTGKKVPADFTPLEVKAVLEPGLQVNKPLYERFLTEIKSRLVRQFHPTSPKELKVFEKRLGFKVLPGSAPASWGTNASSLLLLFEGKKPSERHLVAGDINRRALALVERSHLPVKVRSIEAAHHGCDFALMDLLDATHASKIVISAHEMDRYGHPCWTVMQQLARMGNLPDYRKLHLQRLDPSASEVLRKEARNQYLVQGDLAGHDTGKPFFYGDILLTGERGDLLLGDHGVVGSRRLTLQDRFHLEMLWNELRYADEEDLKRYRKWAEVKSYLGLRVYLMYEKIEYCASVGSKSRKLFYYCLNSVNPLSLSKDYETSWSKDDTPPLWMMDTERILSHVLGERNYEKLATPEILTKYCSTERLKLFLARGATRKFWVESLAQLKTRQDAEVRKEVEAAAEQARRAVENAKNAKKAESEMEAKMKECMKVWRRTVPYMNGEALSAKELRRRELKIAIDCDRIYRGPFSDEYLSPSQRYTLRVGTQTGGFLDRPTLGPLREPLPLSILSVGPGSTIDQTFPLLKGTSEIDEMTHLLGGPEMIETEKDTSFLLELLEHILP